MPLRRTEQADDTNDLTRKDRVDGSQSNYLSITLTIDLPETFFPRGIDSCTFRIRSLELDNIIYLSVILTPAHDRYFFPDNYSYFFQLV